MFLGLRVFTCNVMNWYNTETRSFLQSVSCWTRILPSLSNFDKKQFSEIPKVTRPPDISGKMKGRSGKINQDTDQLSGENFGWSVCLFHMKIMLSSKSWFGPIMFQLTRPIVLTFAKTEFCTWPVFSKLLHMKLLLCSISQEPAFGNLYFWTELSASNDSLIAFSSGMFECTLFATCYLIGLTCRGFTDTRASFLMTLWLHEFKIIYITNTDVHYIDSHP